MLVYMNMKRIVILGAKGMLGRDLRKVFADESPYVLDKEELDITNRDAVFCCLERLKPDVVINAAAYTDVDGCETNRELAMKVNGAAPGYLACVAKNIGAILVHYSTDYVFSGEKAEGYSEDDRPGSPVNFYGETKLVGENAIRDAGGNYYIIRTSWLFGLNGKNFVETILRHDQDKSQKKKELKVVNDQHGKPTFSLDLAKKTKEILSGSYDFGTYHTTNEPATTWYDFARAIIDKRNIIGKKNQKNTSRRIQKLDDRLNFVYACSSLEFPRPAKRPAFSILLNTKLPPLRPWREALEEYLKARSGII